MGLQVLISFSFFAPRLWGAIFIFCNVTFLPPFSFSGYKALKNKKGRADNAMDDTKIIDLLLADPGAAITPASRPIWKATIWPLGKPSR